MGLGGRDPVPPLLAAALAAGLGVQLLLPTAPPPAAPRLRPAPRAAVGPAALTPPATPAYPAILLRPLFSPSRSASASPLAGAPAPAGSLQLLGVARDARRASASLRDAAGAIATLRPGESLHGWRLVAVGRDRAVLRAGGVDQVLQVGAGPAAGGAASAAPAQAPAD